MITMSFISFRDILLILLALAIGEIYYEIKTRRIILLFRKISYYFFNKSVRIKVFCIHKYKNEPKRWLSDDIFQKIQKDVSTDKLLIKGINERCIKLYSDSLGHSILIWLEEEYDLTTMGMKNPEIMRYNSKIEIEDEIRLGRRDFDELSYFSTIARSSQEIIKSSCFPENTETHQKFAVCNIRRDFKSIEKKEKTITEGKFGASISISGSNITISLKELSYLIEVAKKYYFK
jgi:hypothetical protein